jgi:hypothetical protein
LAGKSNESESEIDKTSFWWAGLCAMCHPGGGPTEFDRDGELYWDPSTSQFGYEKSGLTANDVRLDGDYSEINHMTGAHRDAPWDVTGVLEADCLFCHRSDRAVSADGTKNLNWIWRSATLRAKDGLKNTSDATVPAFASASAAGQGWGAVATKDGVSPPLAETFDIDYSVGVTNGSLTQDAGNVLRVAAAAVVDQPRDYACWGCHLTADLKKRGRAWFDPAKDVHYAGFNNLRNMDAGDDVPALESNACTQCHPAGSDHNLAKGSSRLGSVRDDLDYENFQTCRDCHTAGGYPGAPVRPSDTYHMSAHVNVMSCEVCHIPYKTDAAVLAIDNATTGSTISYNTDALLSNDPLNPGATRPADDHTWYPDFILWEDDDAGTERLKPVKMLQSAWWGDWVDNDPAGPGSEDVIKPIALWRVRGHTGGAPLVGVVDDNGDGKAEVNTLAEMLIYIQAFRTTNDTYGNVIAANPVLVKGGLVYHDSDQNNVVTSFSYENENVHAESNHPFSVNHNVLTKDNAISSCGGCHGADSPVFDRKVLVDPFNTSAESSPGAGDGAQPVYKTVSELTGVDPD